MVAKKIEVWNNSTQTIAVTCFDPSSNYRTQWGAKVIFGPDQVRTVYAAGKWERGPRMIIEQILPVTKDNGRATSLVMTRTRFKSKPDRNWIVRDDGVHRATYNNPKQEAKRKLRHEWELKADSVTLLGLEYDLPDDVTSWSPVGAAEYTVANEDTEPVNATFEIGSDVTRASSWSDMISVSQSFEFKVEGSIPIGGGSSSITIGNETTRSRTEGTSVMEKVNFGLPMVVTVRPGKVASVTTLINAGELDCPYTATLRLTFPEVTAVDTKVKGVYTGVTVFQLTATNHPQVPIDVERKGTIERGSSPLSFESTIEHSDAFAIPEGETVRFRYNEVDDELYEVEVDR